MDKQTLHKVEMELVQLLEENKLTKEHIINHFTNLMELVEQKETEILIKKLQDNHAKWLQNLTYEEYQSIGEEEFSEWLQTEVKKVE